mgnify:CR=1 FL=1
MKPKDEPEFALNEAALFFDKNKLIVSFGDGRSAAMDLENEEERQLVRTLLGDVNLWASFFGSLSAAMRQHK